MKLLGIWTALTLALWLIVELVFSGINFYQTNGPKSPLFSYLENVSIARQAKIIEETEAARKASGDERALLPNYPDQEYAQKLFTQFYLTDQRYVPFVGWRRPQLNADLVTVSQDGYRQHNPDPKDSSAARLFGVFGGSTIWGTGADNEHTIPALLDYLLPDTRVLNYGESGWNSRQSLDLLINLLNLGQAPETIVFYDGVNDIWASCLDDNPSPNTHIQENRMRTRLDDVARTNSRFICHEDASRAELTADLLLANWQHAHDLAVLNDKQFFAVLQPVSFLSTTRLDHIKLDEIVEKQYSLIYPIIKQKIAELGVPWVIDMTDAFDIDEYIYIDFSHVSDNGNALIAQRLDQLLKN